MQVVLGFESPAVVGGPMPARDLREEDCRFGRLPLAEEDRLVTVRPGRPVGKQLAGVGRDAVPVARTPAFDLAPDVVDQCVHLSALAGESKSKVSCVALFFLETGTGMNDSLGRRPGEDLPRRSMQAEFEMAFWWVIRRVENRVRELV